MKKYILPFIIVIILISLTSVVFGAEEDPENTPRPLELEYPEFRGYVLDESSTFPNFIRYIYYFILGIAGVIALIVIILAGLQYTASAGSPDKMMDAKSRIFSALLGLIILFSSYLILNQINPEIKTLAPIPAFPIIGDWEKGISLCNQDFSEDLRELARLKDQYDNLDESSALEEANQIVKDTKEKINNIKGNCLAIPTYMAVSNWPPLDTPDISICSVPSEQNEYGAYIIYSAAVQGGYATSLVLPEGGGMTGRLVTPYCEAIPRPARIGPFILGSETGCKATIYETPNYNIGYTDEKESDEFQNSAGQPSYPYDFSFTPRSISVGENTIAVLGKESSVCEQTGSTDTFLSSDPHLGDNLMIVSWVSCDQVDPAYRAGTTRQGEQCAISAAKAMCLICARTL